jgi:hypothetical protein
MNPVFVTVLAFVCIFGGAVLGMLLRGVLPEHHISEASKDVIKVAIATVATLAALVLGLLVSSAKTSFDTKENELRGSSARLILLDRTLAAYGLEAKGARDLLRQTIALRLRQIWPESGDDATVVKAIGQGAGIEAVQRSILELSPKNDTQQWAKSAALQIVSDVAAARWVLFEQTSSVLQWPFLVILIFWLVVIFGSFGLFAPRNASVVVALIVAGLSMAGSIYLVLELDQPYDGLIKISSYPLRMALDQLGKP